MRSLFILALVVGSTNAFAEGIFYVDPLSHRTIQATCKVSSAIVKQGDQSICRVHAICEDTDAKRLPAETTAECAANVCGETQGRLMACLSRPHLEAAEPGGYPVLPASPAGIGPGTSSGAEVSP